MTWKITIVIILLCMVLLYLVISMNSSAFTMQILDAWYSVRNKSKFHLPTPYILDRFDHRWYVQRKPITINQDRQLVIAKPPVHLNNNRLKLLRKFTLVPHLKDHNLSVVEFFGLTNRTVFINDIDQVQLVPCGINLAWPKSIRYPVTYRGGHYFMKLKKLTNVSDIARHFFRFDETVLKECRNKIFTGLHKLKLLNSSCSLISAHVRRRDYLKVKIPISSYFLQKAFDYLHNLSRSKYGCSVLFMVGDDYKWSVANHPKGRYVHVFERSTDPLVDMCILASADSVIMTIGNFGWMGGYLSGGVVAYQANQRQMHSPATGWIPIAPCPPNVTNDTINYKPECKPK